MPRKPQGLQKRGNVFWLRVRVPDDLRGSLGKIEVRRSLKTSDYAEAANRVRLERAKVDAEFALARRRGGGQKRAEVSKEELWFLASQWFVEAEREALSPKAAVSDPEAALADLGHLQSDENGAQVAHGLADAIVKKHKLEIAPNSDAFVELSHLLHRALIENERRRVARAIPVPFLEEDRAFAGLNAQTALQPVARRTVADLLAAVEADPTRHPVSPKSRLKRETEFRVIREFFGARTRLADIDRDRVRAFVDLIARCPANATKRFGRQSLEAMVALGEEAKLPPMSPLTANAYLGTLSTLFRFAVDEGWLRANPVQGLKLPTRRAPGTKARHPFTIEELQKIFDAPLYRGCVDDEQHYAYPGPNHPRRGRFWLPLIALFTGMRLNEIAQLTTDDLVTLDGVEVILVRGSDDETKRVKTEAGVRFVPIHPELKRIGFGVGYHPHKNLHGTPARLFPELTIASTGYASDNASKWFARFLKKAGVTGRGKVFHSFRHTYRDALREADISAEKVRALGGWSSGRTEDHYGAGLRPSTLARDIEKVGYPGLDLGHLVSRHAQI